jgi:hypothetical protein
MVICEKDTWTHHNKHFPVTVLFLLCHFFTEASHISLKRFVSFLNLSKLTVPSP